MDGESLEPEVPARGLFAQGGNIRVCRMARSVLREHSVRDRSLVVGNLFVEKRSFGGGQFRDGQPLTVFADAAFDGDRFRIARVNLPCEPKAFWFLG